MIYKIIVFVYILFISLLTPLYAEITGTDDKAVEEIKNLDKEYKPWFKPVWQPAQELETLIFTIQAAIGAGVIGFFIGFQVGKHRGRRP